MTTYIVFREGEATGEGEFERQLERLLEKERLARVGSEHYASVQILKDIVQLCHRAQQWRRLNELIVWLMGRRGQARRAQVEMVQLAMGWLAGMREPHRTALVETLRGATAGKIFLEVEYARCVLQLVRGKEEEGLAEEAANILQEVQVETYGSMDRREKLDFILYQMKVLLHRQDQVRFFIVSKKVSENGLNDPDLADLKLTYFAYMAIYYNRQADTARCCHAYRTLYRTVAASSKPFPEELDFRFSARLPDLLSNYVALLVLQPYSQAAHQELQKLGEGEELEGAVHCQTLVRRFLQEEVVSCSVADYCPHCFELFREGFPRAGEHLQQLRRMLVQHDLRVIAKYYSSLSLTRAAQLLRVDAEACEEELCELNNLGVISCRIDRIDGVVDFTPAESETALLREWRESVNGVLELVDLASNLIHREREVYRKFA